MDLSCSSVKVLLFLMNGFLQTSAVTHSLEYLYTVVTGLNFPEITVIGLVDGEQFVYYDSGIKEAVVKAEWIQKFDDNYWNGVTNFYQGQEDWFIENVATAMLSINQTKGVHTMQLMYGCERHEDGTTRGFSQFGYDGEDFIHSREERSSYSVSVPETLASPEVVCHATGFFPKAVMIFWRKDGEDVHEDVDLRETLPNQDGSFQKRSILKVPAEELQKHTYTCVIQHSSLEKELVLNVSKRQILKGGGSMAIIVGVVVALIILVTLIVAVVAGIMVWKKKNSGFKRAPASEESSSTNS
ncbi:BOLA class I histocompatibility antigen, alpha chain BL3-7-like isoform X1 [Tachysurus ichikawai]